MKYYSIWPDRSTLAILALAKCTRKLLGGWMGYSALDVFVFFQVFQT